ncbi:MAG: hypothetical protein DRN04_10220 [Thermoprotei archaeon]|nr:MAG: hypothetical protein DRN04_10220 [Thermoprotei archaeon]
MLNLFLGVKKNIAYLRKFIESISGCADGVDISESSLRYPSVNSVALASILVNVFNVDAIAHVRLADVNHLGFLSLAYAAQSLGIGRLLVTIGDPPKVGKPVSYLASEEALKLDRDYGVRRLKIGAILSLRFPLEKIYERLERDFDFYLMLRFFRGEPR